MSRYTLETIAIIILILWLVGWLVVPIGGNLIHLLLAIILIIIIIRLLRGQSPIP